MKRIIAFCLSVVLGAAAVSISASGISGGGSGVHGLPSTISSDKTFTGLVTFNRADNRQAVFDSTAAASGDAYIYWNDQGTNKWITGVHGSVDDGFIIYNNTTTTTAIDVSNSDNTVTLAGALKSTKSCASTYTRLTPNYCGKNFDTSGASGTTLTTGCNTLAAPDASALSESIYVEGASSSANASVTFYSDASCTTGIGQVRGYNYFTGQVNLVLSSAGASVYWGAGSTSGGFLQFVGYGD